MKPGKKLLLVLLIAQFGGYGYGLHCHSCEAFRGDFETSPCLNDTVLYFQKVNPVECSPRNAINYGEMENEMWNVEDLHLGCGKVEYRSPTEDLLRIQRGCYIQVIKAKTSQKWLKRINFFGALCGTEDLADMEKTTCVCNSEDFCNAASTFGVIPQAFSILVAVIVMLLSLK